MDVLTLAGVFALPRILQSCIALSVLQIAVVLTLRWRSIVGDHERLKASLENLIEERTLELTEAQSVLGRTEKLAAVGRLAGGMAHEINNPGAALIANLEYLILCMERDGKLPGDTSTTLSESHLLALRIARSVRQLLQLSRAAIAESEGQSYDLNSVVSVAVRTAVKASSSVRLPEMVQVEESVPRELRLRGRGQLLEQALCELLAHLVDAAPPGRVSRLRVTALPGMGRVRLVVQADFHGFTAEIRAVLAQPFLGASNGAPGPSLGLTASLGLLRTLGTEVQFEEKEGCTQVSIALEPAPSVAPMPSVARA